MQKKKEKKRRGHQIFMAFSYVQICVKKNISEPAILKPEKRKSSPETK